VKSLYLRIWLTVVAALALFALATGWLVQRHLTQERQHAEAVLAERMAGWGALVESSLPPADAPAAQQADALLEWSRRLRIPLALDDVSGRRVSASESFLRREAEGVVLQRGTSIRLDDGRKLWMVRPPLFRPGRDLMLDGPRPPGDAEGERDPVLDGPRGLLPKPRGDLPPFPPFVPRDWPSSLVLAGLLALLFLAVAGGAYPVVRRLTRRLEVLRQGVETFGLGDLTHRVPEEGRDEVATVAASFNRAAARIQALVQSNQSLLANASHELRSPLARLKMAVAMLDGASPKMLQSLGTEINTNIAELDALVEEVLLSSRLEAGAPVELNDTVDLLGLAAEEAARVDAEVEGPNIEVRGSDRLLRRAVRNLLENAKRYGGDEVSVRLREMPASGRVELSICDRGTGVPQEQRERIFEPFYRMPGHAEREGGVGLGLALVRQIAERHEGTVRCEAREGGGSCFTISLPAERVLVAD
jgi:signal transduction histidine kinase